MEDQTKNEAADDLLADDELSDEALDRADSHAGKMRCYPTLMPPCV